MRQAGEFNSKVDQAIARQHELAEQQEAERAEAAIQAERAAEVDREVAKSMSSERSKRDERVKALLKLQTKRDSLHEGTSPEDVWGKTAARACEEFIDYMTERKFEGASELRHRRLLGGWAMEGYGVAGLTLSQEGYNFFEDPPQRPASNMNRNQQKYDAVYKGTDLWHNIFLCTDGRLRLYANEHFVDYMRRDLLDKDQGCYGSGIRAPSSTPNTLATIPVDTQGDVAVPITGHFSWKSVPKEVEKLPTRTVDTVYDTYTNLMPAHIHHFIEEEPLEDILVKYAVYAESGQWNY
ncbi:MAG TPA: hypothetical protein VFH99_01045 [Candidatus Saccharimonadales bacterium]|nr:hypothetical protein [Candidatus Saccharimonadales bacterium]